jgi:hypothetical protein
LLICNSSRLISVPFRNRNHCHHDTRRANQVPPSNTKCKRSSSEVLRLVSNRYSLFVLTFLPRYSGPADCAKSILRESGIRGLCERPRSCAGILSFPNAAEPAGTKAPLPRSCVMYVIPPSPPLHHSIVFSILT